ncbi:hypothetical protein K488DRAFT_73861 [Vararia minispora EC-137]|uniref:Uncharacterized protein n=1 Tax=Vararia minispora EC-137 TaxID=1314806 RepID=A0ACB8Q9E4_9AGAM|nr:hypothetical protein K488DRAFT_73861 [Vararia minispora EC-137]
MEQTHPDASYVPSKTTGNVQKGAGEDKKNGRHDATDVGCTYDQIVRPLTRLRPRSSSFNPYPSSPVPQPSSLRLHTSAYPHAFPRCRQLLPPYACTGARYPYVDMSISRPPASGVLIFIPTHLSRPSAPSMSIYVSARLQAQAHIISTSLKIKKKNGTWVSRRRSRVSTVGQVLDVGPQGLNVYGWEGVNAIPVKLLAVLVARCMHINVLSVRRLLCRGRGPLDTISSRALCVKPYDTINRSTQRDNIYYIDLYQSRSKFMDLADVILPLCDHCVPPICDAQPPLPDPRELMKNYRDRSRERGCLPCRKAAMGHAPEPISEDRLCDAVGTLLCLQNPDDSSESFELVRWLQILEFSNSAEVFEKVMVEYDYVERTTSVIAALSICCKHCPDQHSNARRQSAMRSSSCAASKSQRGRRFSSWGIWFTYAMARVLGNLALGGETCETSTAVRQAREFPCEQVTYWAAFELMYAQYLRPRPIAKAAELVMCRQRPLCDIISEFQICVYGLDAGTGPSAPRRDQCIKYGADDITSFA